jgi:hypothetical protein
VFATALTLVVVPSLNMVLVDFQRLLRRLWDGTVT